MIFAAVLGSGIAFLDGSVVNSALPHIKRTFDSSLAGQQWVVTGYLLTLGSLLVVGGSLGDLYGRRRMFVYGLVGFAITSMLCGLATSIGVLIAARVLQGVSAALLVPGSLAMLSSVFHPDDRAKAIGSWSGLSGASTAVGPFLGGWLIDTVSWRWVFLINPPIAAAAIVIAQRSVPETKGDDAGARIDAPGALTLSLGLAGIVYALIEGPAGGWKPLAVAAAVIGAAMLVAFALIEVRSSRPMVPLSLFRSRLFAGTNAATFVIWGAIGTVFFFLTIHLQDDLGYSALEAGSASLPVTVMMLFFAAKSGALAQRIGPRRQMIVGPLVIAVSFLLMARIAPGSSYLFGVLPGVFVFGVGLVVTVAPVTATVLAAVEDSHVGIGSAINNAVARVASLLAIAVLPALAGATGKGASLSDGYTKAMVICAVLAALGAVICVVTVDNTAARARSNAAESAGAP